MNHPRLNFGQHAVEGARDRGQLAVAEPLEGVEEPLISGLLPRVRVTVSTSRVETVCLVNDRECPGVVLNTRNVPLLLHAECTTRR